MVTTSGKDKASTKEGESTKMSDGEARALKAIGERSRESCEERSELSTLVAAWCGYRDLLHTRENALH
jgi:hypothetical protein